MKERTKQYERSKARPHVSTPPPITCPHCGNVANWKENEFRCEDCDRAVLPKDGVSTLARGTSYYWCEVPRDVARSLVQEATASGWRKALTLVPPELRSEIAHPARALWKFFLPISNDSDVLELGSGWGSVSECLARTYQTVTALELTLERAQFSAVRFAQEGLNNVTVLHGGGDLALPFPDENFDLVVLNGVLEWLPDSNRGHPREIQVKYLAECYRVLRPGGVVYIGIENRWGYPYWLGKREEHAHLRFVSLLPRWLANIYSLVFRGRGYATWTYSLAGYEKLLNEVGMHLARVLFPVPDYRWIQSVVPLDDRAATLAHYGAERRGWRAGVARVLARANILKWIVPTYGIVGRRPS